MSRTQLLVLFGGQSAEHEVSVISARSMLEHIDRGRYDVTLVGITRDGRWLHVEESSNVLASGVVDLQAAPGVLVDHSSGGSILIEGADGARSRRRADVVFPVLHGPHGEDGTVQGLLELAGLPTVGSGVAGSAVGMDKALAKRVFKAEGLPQLEYLTVLRSRWREAPQAVLAGIEQTLDLPLFVKPARLGSSVGVSRADDTASLEAALDAAARHDSRIIIETAAVGFREIELAVLGNDDPEVSIAGEIVPSDGFYDYESKYVSDDAALIVPARIAATTLATLQALAIRAFQAVGARGLGRVDFFVSADEQRIYVNEINTMPGFTPISMYPRLWEASGLAYPALIDRLVDLAMARHADENAG